jgi:hypothetical protein
MASFATHQDDPGHAHGDDLPNAEWFKRAILSTIQVREVGL